jgi:exopolysaccharide biosynthesis polyprenyl glycosylphosphotransferase
VTRRPARRLAQTAAAWRGWLWVPWDVPAAAAAVLAAHALSPVYLGTLTAPLPLGLAAVTAIAVLPAAAAAGLYDRTPGRTASSVLLRCAGAATAAVAVAIAAYYFAFYLPVGRRIALVSAGLLGALLAAPRMGWLAVRRRRPTRLLFIGSGPLTERLEALARASGAGFEVAVAPPSAAMAEACASLGADEIVVPGPSLSDPDVLNPLLACLPLGCRVRSEPDLYEDLVRATPVDGMTAEWLFGRGWDTSNHPVEAIKRVADVVLAAALSVPALPVSLVIAAVIAARRDGPVLYAQTRVGRHGVPFRILKFRTMRVDAERGKARWADVDDPRQTPAGRFLRRWRLDELPQIVNILRGDMSFVGPRPEQPAFVAQLQSSLPFYAWRHVIRPGLTGWAQVNAPYGASVEDAKRKLEYDLYYVRHQGFLLDLLIVTRTAGAMLRGR